jgi:hypothetical protein
MAFFRNLAEKGAFGVAGLVASKDDTLDKIARHGGLGVLGMLAAKKKKEKKPGEAPEAGEGMKRGGKAKVKKMAKGGSTASKRADGCAQRGKTKGRFV